MTRTWVVFWSLLCLLAGGALVVYLLVAVSPRTADNQLSLPAVLAFFAGLLALCFGIGSLLALALHRRWPALAGAHDERANPTVALRQGILLSVSVLLLIFLGFLRLFDAAFILVALVLVGLLEAFFQSRG